MPLHILHATCPWLAPCKVKLAVTHHALAGETLECTKPLVFLLDPPKNREESGKSSRKKQKKSGGLTDKNFGSVVDIAQFKKAKLLTLGWRMRHPLKIETSRMQKTTNIQEHNFDIKQSIYDEI